VQHLLVAEAQYLQPQTLQKLLSHRIMLLREIVHRTIDLDDNAHLCSIEVNDEALDGMLPTHLDTSQPTTAQALPQYSLSLRRFTPHLPCNGLQLPP